MRNVQMIHREDPLLVSNVERGLPSSLVVGRGNLAFVSGWTFHRRRRIAELSVRVDQAKPARAIYPMPRGDVYRVYAEPKALGPWTYRSGFWAFVPFERRDAPSDARVELVATLSNGHVSTRTLSVVHLEPRTASRPPEIELPPETGEPLIAICMATFNPQRVLFEMQIESIRAQTHGRWVCLISDDRSRPDRQAMIRSVIGDDPRFLVWQSDRRLGYYRNFERALEMVPPRAQLVALSDQDDRWHPEKLESLRERLDSDSGAQLAYGDMRVVDEGGALINPTFFRRRRNNYTNLASLMVGNTVTGAAALFRRQLLDLALPFPQPLGNDFHDQWLAAVALSSGRIAYLKRPIQDYVQHESNAFGVEGAKWHPRRRPHAPSRLRLSNMLLRWRHEYFVFGCPAQLRAKALQMRLDQAPRGRASRTIKRIGDLDGSTASPVVVLWLYLRSIAARTRRVASMGNERLLVHGVLWRWLVKTQSLLRWRSREEHRQALPAPPPPAVGSPRDEPPLIPAQLAEKIAPITLDPRPDAPVRINMLIPTVDLEHFFGAYIGKFNLARALADAGLRIRLVAVDPTVLPGDWRQRVEGYEGLAGMLGKVELEFAPTRESLRLEVNPGDRFIATTSWTAHVAHHASRELGRRRFLFVIQEYDALTYPVGTLGAVVRNAYSYPHVALFSTELLRDFFRRRGLGVYGEGDGIAGGDRRSASFRNAITAVDAPSPDQLRSRPPRLLFYARPEQHAERNLFELGLMALNAALAQGTFTPDWEFVGIGAQKPRTYELAGGLDLEILPRTDQAGYRSLLGNHSIGLALMDTPHPSLVPLEMASAGMLVVTSTFENKTSEAIRSISGNLIPAAPSVSSVADALATAVRGLGNVEARAEAAAFDWPRTWSESFDDALIKRVGALLEQT